jgi:hypothetical protein
MIRTNYRWHTLQRCKKLEMRFYLPVDVVYYFEKNLWMYFY